ncbi:MAG: hypothetical protein AAF847_14060 [Bacteroidota bacterium]
MSKIAGVDYGSKLAGTSVISYLQGEEVCFLQSAKKQDADAFLLNNIRVLGLDTIFLDAPLSLPGVYRNIDPYNDFFYRAVDRLLQAMSPMFLGGLTARAMRLKQQLGAQEVTVIETYPAYLARRFKLADFRYKKQLVHLPACSEYLIEQLALPYRIATINNWHQMDALLAFYSAWRYSKQTHESFGDAEEGQVMV